MPRFFTLGQVRETLPLVKRLIAQVFSAKQKYQEAEIWSQNFVRRVMLMGGLVVDPKPFLENRGDKKRSGERLQAAVEEIQGMGAVIKDLDLGLVDFPTVLHGDEVYICWKWGEDDVEYWHGIHEGFAGRKIIDRDFVDNHGSSSLE